MLARGLRGIIRTMPVHATFHRVTTPGARIHANRHYNEGRQAWSFVEIWLRQFVNAEG
jgi:hypothetical protein